MGPGGVQVDTDLESPIHWWSLRSPGVALISAREKVGMRKREGLEPSQSNPHFRVATVT